MCIIYYEFRIVKLIKLIKPIKYQNKTFGNNIIKFILFATVTKFVVYAKKNLIMF